jgi:hypothetical protein
LNAITSHGPALLDLLLVAVVLLDAEDRAVVVMIARSTIAASAWSQVVARYDRG